MIVNISELQPENIQTIRGIITEIDDDELIISDSSGSIEVDLDDLDDDSSDDIEDFDDDDLDDDLNEGQIDFLIGEQVTIVGKLDDDDDDDDDDLDDLEFDALRISGVNGSILSREEILEDIVELGIDDNVFVQDSPNAVIVSGGAGNDELTGAEGDDFLLGGTGDDLLRGTGGFDTFIFQADTGVDIIADFEPADIIDLGNSFNNIEEILGNGGAATQVEQDTVIDLGDDDSITLLNFVVEDLSAANFALI